MLTAVRASVLSGFNRAGGLRRTVRAGADVFAVADEGE